MTFSKTMGHIIIAGIIMLTISGCSPAETSDVSPSSENSSAAVVSSQSSSTEMVASLSSNVSLGYDEYFSEERVFVDDSLSFDKENIYSIEDSSLFKRKDNYMNTWSSEDFILLWSKEKGIVTGYNLTYDDLLLILNGNKIVQTDLNGNNMKVVYESNSSIKFMISNAELIFFMQNDTVFRLHRQSGKVDTIYTKADIVTLRPLSNYVIYYQIENPEWIKYLAETGDIENMKRIRVHFSYTYNAKTGVLTERAEDFLWTTYVPD